MTSPSSVNGDVADDRVFGEVFCSPADAQSFRHGNVKEDAQAEHTVIPHSLELVQDVLGDNVKEISLDETLYVVLLLYEKYILCLLYQANTSIDKLHFHLYMSLV